MPYTKNDYPSAFKNFDEPKKLKAVEITNQLLADGYDKDEAIPIAISQAKEWTNQASAKEKKDMIDISSKTLDKSPSTDSRPELTDHAVDILPDGNQWQVKTRGAKQASDVFDIKEDAIVRGKTIAKNKRTSLVIHREDGTIERTHSYKDA
ncbi:Uncharacterized protein YdaT [Halolactibacillus halophilus]|uniref:Uncharacterized protein YdaT n=1 Tax=Halolactibacillus halophilus TaxID=306540 RepID=A0A1I5S9H0_9BACI|nr:DUF2188 domain-containing protein [Halolactibacillus halophilus]GEM02705.1 hypothetical protein HHA03_22370 [Halolactibacillus halophilus]SFP66916.1 Uncharacterized protein YdaT [Halolactibacillus halophilus]